MLSSIESQISQANRCNPALQEIKKSNVRYREIIPFFRTKETINYALIAFTLLKRGSFSHLSRTMHTHPLRFRITDNILLNLFNEKKRDINTNKR